jgi:uncharacterized DUF497 family protein
MKKTCSYCTFLINLSGLIPESDLPDNVLLRCGKEARFFEGWPLPVRNPEAESCEDFIAHSPQRSKWEWDENKSRINTFKHGISFEEATSALDLDRNALRIQSKSWESLESLDYENAGIPRTSANTDPVRDQYLFKRDGKVWALISTLRGELGLMTQRVISVRRAREGEQNLYERGLGQEYL